MANTAPFVVQPDLTAIAKRYANESFIADEVMPRVPVGKAEFKYTIFTKSEMFTVPDTLVSRTGRVNQVEFSGSETTDSIKDYGLEDPIPQSDLDNAGPNFDPRAIATMGLAQLIALDREIRVAGTVFNASTFGSSNKATLSGTTQWSDFTNSDPLSAINDILWGSAIYGQANTLVLGKAVFAKLRAHPKVVAAAMAMGTQSASGLLSAAQLANALGIPRVLIGTALKNSAVKGQTASYADVWGKYAALLYIAPNPAGINVRMPTFGLTAQFGERVSATRPDPTIGLRGGEIVRVGESVKEVVIAADMGYLWSAAVA